MSAHRPTLSAMEPDAARRDPVSITSADTERDRRSVHAFIEQYIEIEPTAIPALNVDRLYDPVVLCARTVSAEIVGALLACRPLAAVAASMLPGAVASSKVMELDLLAVAPQHRRAGLGSALVAECETRLRAKGTRIVWGGVTDTTSSDDVAAFYLEAGFTVLSPGEPLPPFQGRTWVMPMAKPPVFWFWKKLA